MKMKLECINQLEAESFYRLTCIILNSFRQNTFCLLMMHV